jgi:6-pyruvoyltetrahydropterin/6-carboxytetrahydropterin synthase
MYEVSIRKTFSAAHVLQEIGGKCEALHGHNFDVEVTIAGARLSTEGLLIDFRVLKNWTEEVLETLDHKHLNEIDCFRGINPSSENIARYIYEAIASKAYSLNLAVASVTVWESENARVRYRE